MSRVLSPGYALARQGVVGGAIAAAPVPGMPLPAAPAGTYATTGFIGGSAPIAGGAALPVAGGTPQSIQSAYNAAYDSALAANTRSYNDVLSGYQQVAAGQRAAQDAVQAGYSGLAGRAQAGSAALAAGVAPIRQEVDSRLNVLQDAFDWRNNSFTRREGMLGDLRADLGREFEWLDQSTPMIRDRNAGISGGYDRLTQNVMASISGLDAAERRRQQDAYLRDFAGADQSATSRGLGNTTIRDSLQRGVTEDFRRAETELTAATQRNNANYLSQLGLAGLGFQERGLAAEVGQGNLATATRAGARERLGLYGIQQDERHVGAINEQQNLIGLTRAGYGERLGLAELGFGERGLDRELGIGQAGLASAERGIDRNTALARAQLGFQEGVSAPYPNAGAYAQLAEAAAARQQADRLARNRGLGEFPSPGGSLTTQPSGRGLDDVIASTRRRAEQLYPLTSATTSPFSPNGTYIGNTPGFAENVANQYRLQQRQIDQYVQQQLGPGALAGGLGVAGFGQAAGQSQAAGAVLGGGYFAGGAAPGPLDAEGYPTAEFLDAIGAVPDEEFDTDLLFDEPVALPRGGYGGDLDVGLEGDFYLDDR